MEIDPHRPMRHIMTEMEAIDLCGPAALLQSPAGARAIYIDRQSDLTLWEFLEEMKRRERTIPAQEECEAATVMLAWSLITSLESGLCQLAGYALGHPRFGSGVPVRTSPVLSISEDFTWARSWNRFYRIVDPSPGSWMKLEISGYDPQAYCEVSLP